MKAITTTHRIPEMGVLGSETQHNDPPSKGSDTAHPKDGTPKPTEHKISLGKPSTLCRDPQRGEYLTALLKQDYQGGLQESYNLILPRL